MIGKQQNSSHYLERYQAGQYREVWNELVQLGPAVFEDQLYPEVLSVAQAMMRRVRFNIETLIAKLLQIGFVFGYDFRLQVQLQNALTSAQEKKLYKEMCELTQKQPFVFIPAGLQEEEQAEYEQMPDKHPFVWEDEIPVETNLQRVKRYLQELEQRIGPVPLIIKAWFEEVEAVNFYGYHPRWHELAPVFRNDGNSLMSHCDPFQVCALDEPKVAYLKEKAANQSKCVFDFASDHDFKDYYGGTSTPYYFALPQASADATMPGIYGTTTFVEYLRFSLLSWSGFPGMSQWPVVPQDDLKFLTSDLLPF